MKIHAFFPVGTLRVSRRAILVKLGSLGSLALGAMILTSQGAPVDYRYPRMPGQLIVGFKAGVADAQEDVIHHTHGDQTLHRVSHLGNARLIQIGGHHNLDQAIREYEAEGLVSYAEPNYLVHADVSGTIGAVGNNGVGVAGLNWTTAIMGLKFLDAIEH